MRGNLLWTLVIPGAGAAIVLVIATGIALTRAEDRDFDRNGQALAERVAAAGNPGSGTIPVAQAVQILDPGVRIERQRGDGSWAGDVGRAGPAGLHLPRLYTSAGPAAVRLHVDGSALAARQSRILLGCAAAIAAIVLLSAAVAYAAERRVLGPLRALAADGDDVPAAGDGIQALGSRMRALQRDLDACREALRQRTYEATHYQAGASSAATGRAQSLAVVGDRLRQPLQAMTLFIDSLKREASSMTQRQAVERLQQCAASVRTLLDELQTYARLDAGVVPVQADQVVEVAAVFGALREDAARNAAAHAVELHWHDNGASLRSDPDLLGCLLGHLIENAIESAPRGRVMVAARHRGGRVRLEVRDNGSGIARLHQAKVFDGFFQLGDGARRSERKLGLGLATCARIASLLGSGIGLRSELGRGSVFWIDLPLAAARQAAAHAPRPRRPAAFPGPRADAASLSPRRVAAGEASSTAGVGLRHRPREDPAEQG
ncbi:sensor histidine kinase [Pseudoxanthomonas suwonensis]|uniref:histidine kinase n=1 Tax=Pseudoxanthomonas suwonensis TaxID=314722 RepID=A0A0E3Z1X9_9GAMM|nr:HAMP domain-containing sensor histidine kinase [Pseudoxanthomonas suwonensis]AKC85899.1 hypothetical protein WQ53_03110 [Pseudoxanthomonas suwonensis]